MLTSLFFFILAGLGLGFLVFIHELGHYYAARAVGMRVEVFSIGFGQPIKSWDVNGVRWQICWIPFGGYVKIAGMEREGDLDPHEISDGFFGKSPLARIIVAIAGPAVNLLFALLIFSVIWMSGGREKMFSDVTHRIGWVDPQSELFENDVRPGDLIYSYDDKTVAGFRDHLTAVMTSGDQIYVTGDHLDGTPIEAEVTAYPHPGVIDRSIRTVGVLETASYLIYDKFPNAENSLPPGSPMADTGLSYGDRIVWVDGERVFSLQHLSHLLNDHRCLLTVQRGETTFLARVPRVPLGDLRMDSELREELNDWRLDADLKDTRFRDLLFIPYNLTDYAVVESQVDFLDLEDEKQAFPAHLLSRREKELQPGDRILAVDGVPIQKAEDLVLQLQERQVHLIVARGEDYQHILQEQKADRAFFEEVSDLDLKALEQSIGTSDPLKQLGNLVLLGPVTPLSRADFPLDEESRLSLLLQIQEGRERLQRIENAEQREQALKHYDKLYQQKVLGIPGIQDRKVIYNPNPLQQFNETLNETYTTFVALFKGYLNPKWLSGPVGIVGVIQSQWHLGIAEASFWIALISLNLGILNLLPIPVLDGGYICLSLYEIITRKRIRSQTVERLIIPFALLLIFFLIYVTFHDLSRLFGRWIGF